MAESTATPPKSRRKAGSRPVPITSKPRENTPPGPPEPDDNPPEAAQTIGEAAPVSLKPFPPAPKGKGKGGYCDPHAGMDYWRSLPPEFLNRTQPYINREWPVLDRMQELSAEEQAMVRARKKKEPSKYIDKPAEPFGPDTRMEFLRRYGSGIYKVFINDTGVKGKRDDPDLCPHNLCRFIFECSDTDFPPVLDPSRPDKGLGILDLNHPLNKSYVTDLRIKGVLPLEGADMGATAASGAAVESLANKVGEIASELANTRQDQLFSKLKEEIRGSRDGNSGEDRLIQMMQLFLTATRPQPQADQTTPLIQLFQTQIQSLTAELHAERDQRRKDEEALRTRLEQPPPDPFSFFERMTDTFQKAKTLFGGINPASSTGPGGDHAPRSRMSGTLEFIREIVPDILNAPILTALAQRMMMPAAPSGMAGGTVSAETAGAGGTPNPAADDAALFKFVQSVVTPAMLSYLESDQTGSDFAEWLYCGFPDQLAGLQKRGPGVILATYQQSPLWPRLLPRQLQFQKFVSDFCAWSPNDYPDGEDDDEPAGPIPVNGRANGRAEDFQVIDLDAQLEGGPIEGASL